MIALDAPRMDRAASQNKRQKYFPCFGKKTLEFNLGKW
jgi:hypothetical protein